MEFGVWVLEFENYLQLALIIFSQYNIADNYRPAQLQKITFSVKKKSVLLFNLKTLNYIINYFSII